MHLLDDVGRFPVYGVTGSGKTTAATWTSSAGIPWTSGHGLTWDSGWRAVPDEEERWPATLRSVEPVVRRGDVRLLTWQQAA